MARSGAFVYMRYASSAVGLLPWEGGMGSSRTAFSIVTSRRSARTTYSIFIRLAKYQIRINFIMCKTSWVNIDIPVIPIYVDDQYF